MHKTPLFKDLSDIALVDAYWAQRALAANADAIVTMHAQAGARRRANRGVGSVLRATRNMDICLAIIRQRRLSLDPVQS